MAGKYNKKIRYNKKNFNIYNRNLFRLNNINSKKCNMKTIELSKKCVKNYLKMPCPYRPLKNGFGFGFGIF